MSRPNTLVYGLRKRPRSFLMGVTVVTPNILIMPGLLRGTGFACSMACGLRLDTELALACGLQFK